MLQKIKESNINYPRIILYSSCVIIVSILLYINFFVTPKIQYYKLIPLIKNLYKENKIELAIKNAKIFIKKLPNDGKGYFWLAKCYDKFYNRIKLAEKEKEQLIKFSKNSFFLEKQRKLFKEKAEKIEKVLKKLEKKKEKIKSKILKNYEKALKLDKSLTLEIVKMHIKAERYKLALKILQNFTPSNIKEKIYKSLFKIEIIKNTSHDLEKIANECRLVISLFNNLASEEETDLLNKNISNVYYLLGLLEENKKNIKKAIEFYKKGLKFYNNNITILFKLSDLAQKEKKYNEALKYLIDITIINPNSKEAYYKLSVIDAILWDIHNSIKNLKKSLYLDIDNPDQVIYKKILNNSILKERLKNIPDYMFLIKFYENIPINILYNLNYALFQSLDNFFDNAINISNEIINKNKDLYTPYLILYRSLLGKKRQKIEWFKEKDKLEKKIKNTKLKDVKERLEKKLEEIKNYIKDMKLDKININNIEKRLNEIEKNIQEPLLKLSIANFYYEFYFYKKAIEKINKINFKDKNIKIQALILQAKSYINLDKKEEALKIFDEAIKIAPKYPLTHLYKAQLLEILLNKKQEAIKEYKILLNLVKIVPRFYYKIGKLLMDLNKYKEAKKYFIKSIKLYSKKGIIYYYIAKIYAIENNTKKAFLFLEKCFKNLEDLGLVTVTIYLNEKDKNIWKKYYNNPKYQKILEKYVLD